MLHLDLLQNILNYRHIGLRDNSENEPILNLSKQTPRLKGSRLKTKTADMIFKTLGVSISDIRYGPSKT